MDASAIFGGHADGFVEATDANGTTYVAIGGAEQTSALARRTQQGVTSYDSWDALVAAHPSAADSAAVAALATAANAYVARHRPNPRHTSSSTYVVIADPAAFRKDYARRDAGTFVLRYQAGTAFNETRFNVDWDEIAPPSVEGGVLTAFFSEGRYHQPVRGTFDLEHATLATGMPLTPAFTTEIVRGELDPVSPATVIDDWRRAPDPPPPGGDAPRPAGTDAP